MKYGIYQDYPGFAILHSTTVDPKKATTLACDMAFDEGGTWSVFELGPETPERIEPFKAFQPKLVYSVKRNKS